MLIIFFIITTAVCVLGSTKTFHLVETQKTWQEARLYCRTHHTDLATIRTQEESDHLLSALPISLEKVWIGLHRDTTDPARWRWTELLETPLITSSDYSNWGPHQHKTANCTYVYKTSKKWFPQHCTYKLYFLCDDGSTVHQVDEYRTWQGAQRYCEEHYQGLATITEEDMVLVEDSGYHGWIGLFKDADDVWKWAGETQTDFRKWGWGQPDNQGCAAITTMSDKPSWKSISCSAKADFVCYEDKVILVKENKTWEEALEFCRSLTADLIEDPTAYNNHRYDLASLLSEDHYISAMEKIQAATTDQVWTGLRFLAGRWLWVNGDQLQYQDLPLCPAQWQHCGTLPKDGATPWEVRDCQERRNFFCFKRR